MRYLSDQLLEAVRYQKACETAARIDFLSPECKEELRKAAEHIDKQIKWIVEVGEGVVL